MKILFILLVAIYLVVAFGVFAFTYVVGLQLKNPTSSVPLKDIDKKETWLIIKLAAMWPYYVLRSL